MMTDDNRLFRATLLIAGTTIGGGMLALPISTGLGGFIPSVFMLLICWAVMLSTGMLTLEVCLWMKGERHEGEINFITMASHTLGNFGKWAAWGLYIFLFYSLVLVYTLGCGSRLALFFGLAPSFGPALFLAIFSPFIYAGARFVGLLNIPLTFGLMVCYFIFVWIGFSYVDQAKLSYVDWSQSLRALPVIFTAFGFHGSVPTLVRYVGWNGKTARRAIVLGSLIPLVVYIVWQWLILGIIPIKGNGGLTEALVNGHDAVQPLGKQLQMPSLYIVGQFLAFFALITSFLGVSLGLVDFLSDGLNLKRTRWGELFLCVLIFIPVLIVAMTYPGFFLIALDYAGGYGGALLLAMLPILMAWSGRYRMGYVSEWKLPGGKFVLVGLALFVIFEIYCATRLLII